MKKFKMFDQLFNTNPSIQETKNQENLQISLQQKDDLLKEIVALLKMSTKLQQIVKIQQQENEAKEEALYGELLDIFDSLEFLINYLDNNLQDENFNSKALKRLPKFVTIIKQNLLTILSRRGVEKIQFDENMPDFNVCEVIDDEVLMDNRELRDDIPDKTVTKVVRQGFKIKEKILRYVEVITAKSKD
ncbi:nucleotide exchange factor GrpE [Geminocystis sp. GBBB08]|uniref:nucleotide exchange factor GrpE n=1 Tax=Geminocystis sp. GBBB08 TaxID=2604140 RepID=UPI0027E2766E|nr:nucleotide exchange factor GrpE [Geminocystis sp. GBBB08]MBL1211555.1 nucleotide exchange factor GrpE [Geminocystis sp. GBBB08]